MKGRVRAATETDREEIQAWIDGDPDHKGMSADFFIVPEIGTECMVYEDEEGPILYYRIARVLRIDMQFDERQRERTARALGDGFPWLQQQGKRAGFWQMIFSSISARLTAFCKGERQGFVESPHEFICYLQDKQPTIPQ